jgi:uncharacterized protein (TIGR03083 family)
VAERDGPVATYTSAASSFAGLVHQIPAERFARPGLGQWDLRSLVGHTSRSLTTVSTYLQSTAEREDLATPQQYYAHARATASAIGSAGVVERGRQAGEELGTDPAAAVDRLVERVRSDLAGTDDRLIEVIGGAGIRLHAYLPTRTFELAVHSLDIARAADVPFTLPADVLDEAAVLAVRIAVAMGEADTVLMSLTGRTALPSSFSVV